MARSEMNTEYFSGSQASIFIGDIWVDEIIDWQCSVGANATPIYGYGDTFFRHAAEGRVLVQGSFTVNFKEPNYLFAILDRYRRFNSLYDKKGERNKGERGNPYSPVDTKEPLKYSDKRNKIEEFFIMSREYDKAIKKESSVDQVDYINALRKYKEKYKQDGINFNNDNFGQSSLSGIISELENNFAVPLFNIKIGYGTVFDEDTVGEQILDVKLVGKGKAIMANGEPLKESYSFFARNLV